MSGVLGLNLEQGEALSYQELASKAGFTPGYVQKVLPLAFLAPGLTHELLDCRRCLHGGLVAQLNRCIPFDWDQQITAYCPRSAAEPYSIYPLSQRTILMA